MNAPKVLRRLARRLLCLIGDHEWTCDAEQGIAPRPGLHRLGMLGFLLYARGYCLHCGKTLPPSAEEINQAAADWEQNGWRGL